MIEIDKTPRFKTADGALHGSLADAQIHSLSRILSGCTGVSSDEELSRVAAVDVVDAAKQILKSWIEVIAILKMKPRKRKAKSASKPKSAKLKTEVIK